MEHFFCDKYELGIWELKSDVLFHKIPENKYFEFIDFAWGIGIETAKKYINRLSTNVPSEMIEKLGISILETEKGFSSPEYKIYSEYYSNLKKITLYKKNIINEFEQLSNKNITDIKDYSRMRELFIAHEIFHHIECHDIGLTLKKKKVVTFKIGPFKLTSGVRALSEIGAHAFTKEIINL